MTINKLENIIKIIDVLSIEDRNDELMVAISLDKLSVQELVNLVDIIEKMTLIFSNEIIIDMIKNKTLWR